MIRSHAMVDSERSTSRRTAYVDEHIGCGVVADGCASDGSELWRGSNNPDPIVSAHVSA